MKFKIGDRIRFNICLPILKNRTGTVRHVCNKTSHKGYPLLCIELDVPTLYGHSCGGIVPERKGIWADRSEVERIKSKIEKGWIL